MEKDKRPRKPTKPARRKKKAMARRPPAAIDGDVPERERPTVDRLLRLRYVPPRSREILDAAAALMPLSPEWQKRYAGMKADA